MEGRREGSSLVLGEWVLWAGHTAPPKPRHGTWAEAHTHPHPHPHPLTPTHTQLSLTNPHTQTRHPGAAAAMAWVDAGGKVCS